MPRVHRMTHPVLGPVSWHELQLATDAMRREGKRPCSWCLKEVPLGLRTRCGNKHCAEMIWQLQSWQRCRRMALKRSRRCECSAVATEVDHIVPMSLGGLSDEGNLRGLCHNCHKLATAKFRAEKEQYTPWRYSC